MKNFDYRDNELCCEGVRIEEIAKKVGTPLYLYSQKALVDNYKAFDKAFKEIDHLICYSCKVNSNLSICKVLKEEGAGADVVSGGELYKALKVGVDPKKIVFSGVGKTREEIKYALKNNILMLNVESIPELELTDEIAGRLKKKAPVALRINPDIDPNTHPHISTGLAKSKFGIEISRAKEGYKKAKELENIEVLGIHMHIGSQITELEPFVNSLGKIVELIKELEKERIRLKYLDIGGGLGISYKKGEKAPTPKEFAERLLPLIKELKCKIILEPGRAIVGDAGILVTKVLYVKKTEEKSFVIVDAAMNDLIRPSLYNAYHEIIPIKKLRTLPRGPRVPSGREANSPSGISSPLGTRGELSLGDLESPRDERRTTVDVVGPVCESGDYFAKDRELAEVKSGDLLAILDAGAYGFSMSSNYNARPKVAEILVEKDKFCIIRKREDYEDLIRGEQEE
ncbi:diaminopimelate decarboxylase [bacterium]|nr:diaminopimelate decarboxylase [bacterium]